MSEINIDYSCNDSFSISCLSSKEQFDRMTIKEDECQKYYPIRCPICSRIPRFYAEFEKNSFYTICDNNHRMDYNTFDSFYENSNKKLDSVLCEECHKSLNDDDNAFQCNNCYFFLCQECKSKHEEETNHLNYVEKNKIDIYCPKHNKLYKYYDNKKKSNICENCLDENEDKNVLETSKYIKYVETLDAYVKKVRENILISKNINKLFNEWLEMLKEKIAIFLDSINNYTLLQQKIVTSLSYEKELQKYENNFNVFFNYEIINDEKIDKYIKNINSNLNNNYNKNDDFFEKSNLLINLLNNFSKKEINISSKKNIAFQIEIKKETKFEDLFSRSIMDDINKIKVENMINNKHEMKSSKVKCLIPFCENKMIIVGLSSGKIKLFDKKEKEKEDELGDYLIKKLSIKAFEKEISNLCELDNDLIVATDNINNAKIIQLENNMSSYSVIQNLDLNECIGNIHTIANFPIFSYYKNRHYFGMGDDNHLLIFKSNKMPKNLSPPALGYHDQVEEYSIVQPSFILPNNNFDFGKDENEKNSIEEYRNRALSFNLEKKIELNTLISCMVEIDEKYIAVACPKNKSIKIYNSQRDFKEVTSLPNISPSEGNCTMAVSHDRNKLFVACTEGFCIITINNLKKMNRIHLKQSILCLDFFKRDCISCISLKGEEYFIKQYILKNNYRDISKLSEQKIYPKEEINYQKVIDKIIFYLDDSKAIHYLK